MEFEHVPLDPDLGHFLHIEAPEAITEWIAAGSGSNVLDRRGETPAMSTWNPKG